MSPSQAKQVLLRWRPGLRAPADPELDEALAAAESDPALATWLRRHAEFQTSVTQSLRQMPVPDDLATQILLRSRVRRPVFPRIPTSWLAIAACVLVLGIALVFLVRPGATAGNDLATFRSRMVRAALREYRMDITTNDLAAIRGYLAQSGAPSDFDLPPRLAQLAPVGAGSISWQHQQAAMVCLDAGKDGMFFLFVADQSVIDSPSLPVAEFNQVNRLSTGTWTRQGRIYVLASALQLDSLRTYL